MHLKIAIDQNVSREKKAKAQISFSHCVIRKRNPNPNLNRNLQPAICQFRFSDWKESQKCKQIPRNIALLSLRNLLIDAFA